MEITPADSTKLRIRVAELMGWQVISYTSEGVEWFGLVSPSGFKWHGFSASDIAWTANVIPAYDSDLNACHEFEEKLTAVQQDAYTIWLHAFCVPKLTWPDCNSINPYWYIAHATATQRSLAFIAVMEKQDSGEKGAAQ